MAHRQRVIPIPPADLTPNPLNAVIYDATPTADLIESIRERGIIEPLVASPERVLVSGHRRRLAAIGLGLAKVPVILRPVEDEVGEIIAFNTHRKKTWTEVYREARMLQPRAEAAAALRKLEGARRGASIRHGGNGSLPKPRKRAIEDVAERLNISRETLRKLLRIFEAVDRDEAPRDIVVRLDAGGLTVHQAHRYVCRAKVLAARRAATDHVARHGLFDWSARICWTDVWEFYDRRDNSFHDVHNDADVVLNGAYGAPPADLFINIIHHFSSPGDLVVDPFAGRGQVHSIAEAMGRRAWSSDLRSRTDIAVERDAAEGPPRALSNAQLIIMDPPYGRDFTYTEDLRDLSHADIDSGWVERMAAIVRRWQAALCGDGLIALVIGNRFHVQNQRMLDRSWHLALELAADFEVVRRISAPYSPSHFRGYRIDWAERNGVMLSRSREILILQPH